MKKTSIGQFVLTFCIILSNPALGMNNAAAGDLRVVQNGHLVAYDQRAQANQGFQARLRYLSDLIYPRVHWPVLEAHRYPQQDPDLEQALAQEVRTSMSEEARMTREISSWGSIIRRMAGTAILSQAVWWPLGYATNRIEKLLGQKQTNIFICALVLGIGFMPLGEILLRVHRIPDLSRNLFNGHRRRIELSGLMSQAMALRLKARPEFLNNQAASRVIDQMTYRHA